MDPRFGKAKRERKEKAGPTKAQMEKNRRIELLQEIKGELTDMGIRRKSDRKANRTPKLPKADQPKVVPVVDDEPTTSTDNEKKRGAKQREHALKYRRKQDAAAREIAPMPPLSVDWERRRACSESLKLFCETYMRPVFYLDWSVDQLKCITKIEQVVKETASFALAMPRGGGKTALCRAGILWATLTGRRTFPFLVGASHPKAVQSLSFIKQYLYQNVGFREDFPEIVYPMTRLENRWHLARGQSYYGELTYIEWGTESISFPCCIFPREEVAPFIKHGFGDSFTYREEYDGYISIASGSTIRTSGVDGSIRGEAETHPITLTQPRPDMVILDDIQRDAKVESPETCRRLVALVDGAVSYLAGPDRKISALMPCTVIRDGDVSSIYLDRQQKPEWLGERCSFVLHWPDGISDYEIDNDSEAGKLWLQYDQLRRQSLALRNNITMATEYYVEEDNRKIMDDGFLISWPEMYDRKSEVSAQQRAMNLRFTNHASFLAEGQNIGRRLDGRIKHITSKALRNKQLPYPRCHVPPDTTHLVAFIDVQMEILFYTVLAVNPSFTGIFTDYGSFPELKMRYFTKSQTEGWSLLTREFIKAYPRYSGTIWNGDETKVRAPLDAKIYHAVATCTDFLRKKEYQCGDRIIHIGKIGIDTKWGKASNCLKRFCRESGDNDIISYTGNPYLPSHLQLEEHSNKQGWLFHHILQPTTKESMWVYKPDDLGMFGLSADVNRGKTFLIHRLASPPGSPGCISLYQAPPHDHEMFCNHVCDSEYPDVIEARGLKKECWKEREGTHDNDFLDSAVGCIMLASFSGAQLHMNPSTMETVQSPRPKRHYSEMYRRKREFIRESGGGVGVYEEGYL
jgi:hypothetical protein